MFNTALKAVRALALPREAVHQTFYLIGIAAAAIAIAIAVGLIRLQTPGCIYDPPVSAPSVHRERA